MAQSCVREVDRFGGGSLMVWVAFTSNGRSRLVVIQGNMTAQVYCNQVLRQVLVPFIHNHGPGLTFQHDNARPHTAALTRNFPQNAGIPVMAWSSLSPDMNPIEHVWDEDVSETVLTRLRHCRHWNVRWWMNGDELRFR